MIINAIEKQKNTNNVREYLANKLDISFSLRHKTSVNKTIFFTFKEFGKLKMRPKFNRK